MPWPNQIILASFKQQFITDIVGLLNDIYSYLLEGATEMKQMAPVSFQVYLSNHFNLLFYFLLKFAKNKPVICILMLLIHCT